MTLLLTHAEHEGRIVLLFVELWNRVRGCTLAGPSGSSASAYAAANAQSGSGNATASAQVWLMALQPDEGAAACARSGPGGVKHAGPSTGPEGGHV